MSERTASLRDRLRAARGRIVLTLVLLGIVGAVVWARVIRPLPVLTQVVERGEVVEQVYGRGTIESDREAQLGFDLVGRLSEVLVDEGTRVTLGQDSRGSRRSRSKRSCARPRWASRRRGPR
ncbi:MAG: hypothetical protein R3B99_19670 [Polyangiales bacterium]